VWVCASCGQENPEGFKFCGNCGAPLETPAAPREVRKVVTIVFCDLTGSTALGDRTDPEALRATMRGYYEEMRTILERHGGTVEKFVGDAVMAVFGVPVSHEDDATRAVRAAWEMREAVTSLGLQARIGVNTGEVVAGKGDTLVTAECEYARGDFHEAARIYRQVYDKLGELGEHGFRSTVGIELGEALYELGERDEPERLALDAETMGGPDDLVNFAFGRALRARIAADRGELEAAETLGREALAYGERSDFPQIHARVREALGHVARAAGRTDEARAEFERAIAAHESHGDLVLAERTRQLLVEL